MPLSRQEFLRKAIAIWGKSWASRISELTDINVRTIERMGSGKRKLSDEVSDLVSDMYERWRG